jgi:hypothetical protein
VLRPQLVRASRHFCQLEVPDQVNAMLVRFLAILPSLDVACRPESATLGA